MSPQPTGLHRQTVPEIIKDIFREQGFSDFEERLSGDYHLWNYRVLYRESYFNFVSRLMEKSSAAEINDTWSIPAETIHTDGGGTQYFSMNNSSFSRKPASNLSRDMHSFHRVMGRYASALSEATKVS